MNTDHICNISPEIKKKAEKVHQILGEHILADGFEFVMDYEKSKGSWIVDRKTGKKYLDMFSMYASASIGYNHPYLLDKQEWLGKMAIYKPTMSDVYFQEYADFMDVMSRIAIPKELSYCFFVEGGSLAVENALKVAFDWKTRKNWLKGSKTEGSVVIHFKQAFHGRSGYTLSLTNTADPRKYQYFPLFDWPRVENPKLFFPQTKENLTQTKEAEKRAIEQIKKAISQYGDACACIIIEPIQAEGGDNHFRKDFLQYLRELCDENDILLIFDEVQTGIGITGNMWAYQTLGVTPDLIAFGKKTQVCGVLASKNKMNEVEHHVFSESSRINSTFGGNFIDMLRFQLTLEVIEKENLLQNAKEIGKKMLNGIQKLCTKYPRLFSNPRGLGMMCAFDLASTDLRNKFQKLMYEKQVILLTCGIQSIRFRPHLNLTEHDLNFCLENLDLVAQDLSD